MSQVVNVRGNDNKIRRATVEFVSCKRVVSVKLRNPDGTVVNGRPVTPAFRSELKFNYLDEA